MDRLIALLSVPPPGLRKLIVLPAVLVFSYTVLLSMTPELDRLGLSAFVLAVVFTLFAELSWRIPVVIAQIGNLKTAYGYGINLCFLAVLLYVNDPLWCQRYFTAALGFKVVCLGLALWRTPDQLADWGGIREGPDWLKDSWARWYIVSSVAVILVNETAIRYATLTEWIIVWAVSPVIAHCLMHWTILATWGDETDAD